MDNHYEWRETPTSIGVSRERLIREGVRLAEEIKTKIIAEKYLFKMCWIFISSKSTDIL